QQSYSLNIRDALFARTVQLPFFAGYTARRSNQLMAQPYHLPYLGVYLVRENMTPDGDPNAGEVRFSHDVIIGWSVIIENNDPVASEAILDQAWWAIMTGLRSDPYLMNFLDTRNPATGTSNPDNTRLEGIRGGMRRHVWGAIGLNNERPVAELQYEATVCYRSRFLPVIPDD